MAVDRLVLVVDKLVSVADKLVSVEDRLVVVEDISASAVDKLILSGRDTVVAVHRRTLILEDHTLFPLYNCAE